MISQARNNFLGFKVEICDVARLREKRKLLVYQAPAGHFGRSFPVAGSR